MSYKIFQNIFWNKCGTYDTSQMSGIDLTWMNSFASYLVEIDAPDNWFWCLNPDSGDTGGLLENDWTTPVMDKLNLLQQVQPNPTQVIPQNDKLCAQFVE